ncbi:MAG TPA: hypothetical protein DER60_08900 [Syntrophomonas sp.]|jgi:NAD(P)-dependent dehydrogenase (short-subunit alcohol dehydrogenase family)|nr:hypothetical protein [Syntrophomonas sp.]
MIMDVKENLYSMFGLEDEVALITGTDQGIGEAMAYGLAKAGARIAIADKKFNNACIVAERLEKSGVKALPFKVDVQDADNVDLMVSNVIRAFGTIDILVNNTGVSRREECVKMTEEDWDQVVNVNLKGTFLCSRAVGRIMLGNRKGKVINLASMMSAVVQAKRGPYAASKAGIVQFTKVLAVEWAPYNINVNAIGPGYVLTDINKELLESNTFEYFVSKIPLGRWSIAEDLIGATIFLSSKVSSYITGQVLYVDGGYLCL